MAEERISELEYMSIDEKKQNIQDLWGNCKRCNVCVMGIPEEDKEK